MKQGKEIQKSPLPHTLVGPTALDGRRENLQGATLSDYKKHSKRQGMLSAAVHSSADNGVPDRPWQLLHLLGCLGAMGPPAGRRGTQGLSPLGQEGLALPPAPRTLCLPGRAALGLPALVCKTPTLTPSHAKTPQTSYLKIHRCCKSGRREGENIFFIVSSPPAPFIRFPSLFLFSSVLSQPGCKQEGGKGICLV